VPAGDAERTGTHHHQAEHRHADAEQVRLDLAQFRQDHLAPEEDRHQQVGDRHEGQRGTGDDRGVEVAGNVEGVVHQHVDLLGAEDDAGDAAEEAEADQRDEHAGEHRVAPGRLAQPFEQAVGVALAALRRFDRPGNREAVDHRRHDREVHEVGGVEHLPLGAHARVGQQVVGTRELQEEDVEQEGEARHLLGQRLGAESRRRSGTRSRRARQR
jgi:hypothetical protein